jgi:hypothetical protein
MVTGAPVDDEHGHAPARAVLAERAGQANGDRPTEPRQDALSTVDQRDVVVVSRLPVSSSAIRRRRTDLPCNARHSGVAETDRTRAPRPAENRVMDTFPPTIRYEDGPLP